MTGDDRTAADAATGRRGFLRATAALGAGVAGLASTGTASAEQRVAYTVLDGTEHETTVHYYGSGVDGPTTMVFGGVHGDETAGYRAAADIAEWTVESGQLIVVPRANADAIERDVRPWANDLNRQFPPNGGACETELARTLWKLVEHYDPDWVFDLHSSRGIYGSGDGGVGQAMFPTWSSPARTTGENVVRDLNGHFGLSGDMRYRMGNTLNADEPMLVHRVAGMLDRPGFICETTEKADSVADQVAWHRYCVEHAMRQYGQRRATPSGWSVGSGSDGSSTDGDGGSTTEKGMAIVGTGNETEYAFTVSGTITPGDDVESGDEVADGRAHGTTQWQSDNYQYTGDMETFTVLSGDAGVDIWIEGQKYAASDFPDESTDSGSGTEKGMAVVGTGNETEYAFTTSGSITPGDNVESGDEVTDGRAHGTTQWQSDNYQYTGDMETFTVLSGDAGVDIWIEGQKYAASDFPDESTDSGPSVPLHAGSFTGDHNWRRYGFDADLSDPVVAAGGLSYEGGQPCHLRLDDVAGDGFDARVEEWDYLNEVHVTERAGAVALDAGSHDLGGLRAEVGRVGTTDATSWVGLDGFSSAPVLLTTVQTDNGGQAVVPRTEVWSNGFDVRLQEQQSLGSHGEETVGYFAVQSGTGSVDGRALEADTASANHEWTRIEFANDYTDPVFVGSVQSVESGDVCGLRYRNLTGSSVEVKVEEDQSVDAETWHAVEQIGYLVVEGGN
jgi:hypothetical protein